MKRKLVENEDDSSVGWCMWIAGTPREDGSGVRMDDDFRGLLDNGCLYAPNSYEHPIDKTRIVWGWLKEEDITLGRCESKGWTGCLLLPRELFFTSMPNVTRALGTRLEGITSIRVVCNEEGSSNHTKTLQTLGIGLLQSLATLL